MYFAHLQLDALYAEVAARVADAPSRLASDAAVLANGAARGEHDFAVRVVWQDDRLSSALLLIGDRGFSDVYAGPRLDRGQWVQSAADFDAAADAIPAHQWRIDGRGQTRGAETFATPLYLWPIVAQAAGELARAGVYLLYQANFRRFALEPALVRRVKKYLAWLQLDAPYPPAVLELQTRQAEKMLGAVVLREEYCAASSPAAAEAVHAGAEREFLARYGAMGFVGAPTENGDFVENVAVGVHSTRFDAARLTVPYAGALGLDELRSTIAQVTIAQRREEAAGDRVFVSYAWEDFAVTSRFVEYLEARALRCWFAPRNIPPGSSWPDEILKGIDGSFAMLVFVSPSSIGSPHVEREVERMLQRRKSILPIRLENARPSGPLEYLLSTLQSTNYSPERSAEVFDKLCASLAALRNPA